MPNRARERFRKFLALGHRAGHPPAAARSFMLPTEQAIAARNSLTSAMTVIAGVSFGGALGAMILERNSTFIRSYFLSEDTPVLVLFGLFFVALVAIWTALVQAQVWSPILLPSPKSVAEYLASSFRDGTLLQATAVTLRRLLLGYVIGLAIGLPLGLLTASSKFVEDTIGVLALGLQTLPSVCWVPLALLWFGQTEGAMLFVVIMGTVWSVVIATDTGVRTISPIFARAARTMGSGPIHRWLHVILPASLPYLISGMKQGWAFAWRSLMAAEIYVTILTGFGLGHLLHYGRELNAMDQVIGIMLVIVVIGLLADKILFSPWERFLHRRWGTGRI